MSNCTLFHLTYRTAELIPPPWLRDNMLDDFRVYNPAIVRYQGRVLMAYRVDSGQGATLQRRIGLCELDEQLKVVAGSVLPLSDTIRNGGQRYYDPRFLLYQDRIFLHYNNNFQSRPNQIFLVELAPDTLTAHAPARPLLLAGPRQEIEKNWMLFEHDHELFAVYQIAPHTILRINLAGSGPIACERSYTTEWDVTTYTKRFGPLGGGAPPIRQGDEYISFFHSKQPISKLHWVMHYWPVTPWTKLPRYIAALERRLRRPFEIKRYWAGVYSFATIPPFRPRWIASTPILSPVAEAPYQSRNRINPFADGIVYPCGAIAWGTSQWLLSYGVHDERCCLRLVDLTQIAQVEE